MFKDYCQLMRLHKPIGIFLLLWPTLWALWLAGNGKPDFRIVFIFVLGVVIMRAAGCIINDFADRNLDGHVKRTANRPLVTGKVSTRGALFLFLSLMSVAFLLVLQLNRLTLLLACVGALLTWVYPFMKRFTMLPQVGLGLAFAWGVPMAFAAITDTVSLSAWILFSAAAVWPVMYDTLYAMVDRDDDVAIGIQSTAILFGRADIVWIGFLQILFLALLIGVGLWFHLQVIYYICLMGVSILFIRQQYWIQDRQPDHCFKAFLNNHWVGSMVFIGIVLSYHL